MKIFISYGHNDYPQLVDRLFDALLDAGHQPWKDDRYEGHSGIAPGEDFTKVIYAAIDDADFVIAFVSTVTKEKPYCCDERQYAYNHKGSRFIQLRLDRVEITLGNSRSYIDLSDVVETTGEINEKLLANGIGALFAAFRDPESFAEGGITPWTKINTHLRVPGALRYEEFITMPAADDFVGRQWLVDRVRAWAQDDSIRRRLFVIQGEAGTGKTAFVRHLAQDQELVRSVHVCVYDKPSTRTLRDTLKDLAYVLACKGGAYYEFLKTENLEKIRDMAEDALFEYLFLEPLRTVQEKYLLIIDGLDELEESTGLKPLIRLFRQYADKINPHISFLVTTRPDAYITEQLRTIGGSHPLESIALDREASRTDLTSYIRRKLEALGCYTQSLAAKLLEVCDGNFEYLSLLFREAKEDGLAVTEDMPMPRGLNERYVQYLDRRMESQGQTKLTKEQHKLLSLLSVCCEAIPLSLLAEAAEMDEYDAEEALEVFGSLLRQTETDGDVLVALFTKSFRDFLVGKSCRRYSADRALGVKLLGSYILAHCPRLFDLQDMGYLERNSMIHLLQYAEKNTEAVAEYLRSQEEMGVDVSWCAARALVADTDGTVGGYLALCEKLQLKNGVAGELRRSREQAAAEALAGYYRQAGWEQEALRMEIDLLQWEPTPEKKEKAWQLVQQLLTQTLELYRQSPNYETRGRLIDAYFLGGEYCFKKHSSDTKPLAEAYFRQMRLLAEENDQLQSDRRTRRHLILAYNGIAAMSHAVDAEPWLRKVLELAQQNYEEDKSYQVSRDLAVAFARLARTVRQTKGLAGLEEAESLSRQALQLSEMIHAMHPCYESRDRLATICDQLGNIEKKRHRMKKATEWFRRSLALAEENYRETPGFMSRWALAVSYERLGDMARDTGKVQDAEVLYRQKLPLTEQNYRDNPCYDSRRSLALTYARLRAMAEINGDILTVEKLCNEELQLQEENYRENNCHTSRSDLANVYNKLANLTEKGRREDWYAQSLQWLEKALQLYAESHRVYPDFLNTQNLARAYGRLALLATRPHTPAGYQVAAQWRQLELQTVEEMLAKEARPQEYQTAVNICRSLADMALLLETPDREQEKVWLDKALSLAEENRSKNPGDDSCKLLIDVYGWLGLWEKKKPDGAGLPLAISWFEKKRMLAEANAAEYPTADNRRQLALACDSLGGVLEGEEALALFLRTAQLLEENYRAAASYSTRQDLAVAYGRLGEFFKKKKTPQGAGEAIKWYQKKAQLQEEICGQQPTAYDLDRLLITYRELGDLEMEHLSAS